LPNIIYQDTTVAINEPDTILEGLEKAGFSIPNSCRAGLCHSCLMQAGEQPPVSSQQGLSDNQKAQHYFLACSCIPKANMEINLIGDVDQIQGTVVDKKQLNSSVMALFIQVDCRWFPGQYINVWRNDTVGRSYSIASLCDEQKIIELHVKRHEHGFVSSWLHDEVTVGQPLILSKPMGNCFYSDDHQDNPLLMVSTGTGLAPLYGILQQALLNGHAKDIILYSAAGDPKNLYYVNELLHLSQSHENFYYTPTVRRLANEAEDESVSGFLEGVAEQSVVEKDVVELVKERHKDLKGWKIFLCGSPDMIKQLQRHCFFQGAAVTDILVDAFIIENPGAR
jgi:ferredoxin-NADP reductase